MTGRALPLPDGLDGLRLDVALSRLLGLSRTAAAELIDAGAVTLDGRSAARSGRARAGAWLEVDLPSPAASSPPGGTDEPSVGSSPSYDGPPLRIAFEDDDLVVIDKPAGVAAHPSPGWTGPTVTAGLRAMGREPSPSGAAERQGIVHRLDVGTSGLMVVAKSDLAYSMLKDAFRRRDVDKRYLAMVQGHPDPTAGTIDAPIDRHPSHDARWAVVAGGRPSVTHYETAEAFRSATLLSIRLETGRTHQIRVHMAAVRHPCVGDLLYGADPVLAASLGLTRQWLHAASLRFAHPRGGAEVAVESPPPSDLQGAVQRLSDAS
jgi:23S rRNA pseudouridine1911/1915/1917 synthase